MSVYVIDIPNDAAKRIQIDSLLNILEDLYGVIVRNGIVVVTDETDGDIDPILARLAAYTVKPAPAFSDPLPAKGKRRTKKAEPEPVVADTVLPPPVSEPAAKPARKANGNGGKLCKECGEPARKNSDFCGTRCYMRFYRRTYTGPSKRTATPAS